MYKQNTAIAMVHINKKNLHIREFLITFGGVKLTRLKFLLATCEIFLDIRNRNIL